MSDQGAQGFKCRVVVHYMSYHQDQFVLTGKLYQLVSFLLAQDKGFFNEYVFSSQQGLFGDCKVRLSRGCNDYSVYFRVLIGLVG